MWVLFVNSGSVLDCDWMFARKTFEQFVLTMQDPLGTILSQKASLTLNTALAQMKTGKVHWVKLLVYLETVPRLIVLR